MLIPRARQLRVVLPLAALAIGAAACGGSSSSYGKKSSVAGASSAPTASAPASSADSGGYGGGYGGGGGSASNAAATVAVAKSGELGQILVDGAGRSLYLFEKDKAKRSNCYGECAKVWPPFTSSGPATVGAGAMRSLLGTTGRTDGSTQITYNGHPLYYYISDSDKAGSTAGEGLNQFGAEWYVLSPAGIKVEKGGS